MIHFAFLGGQFGPTFRGQIGPYSLGRSVSHHALKRKWLKLKQLGETRGTEGCQKAFLFETRVVACQKRRLLPWHCFNKRHVHQFFEIDVGPVFWVSKLFSNSTFFPCATIPRKGRSPFHCLFPEGSLPHNDRLYKNTSDSSRPPTPPKTFPTKTPQKV